MSYRYDRERQTKRWWYLAGTLVIVLIFFTPMLSFFFDTFERSIISIWERQEANTKNSKSFFALLGSKQKILDENKLLKERIEILEVDLLRTDYLESVLESYQLIDEEYQQTTKYVNAEIIARYPKTSRDVLMINRGSVDGIHIGSRVVVSGNLAIGVVDEVYDRISRIRLNTTDQVLTPAVVYEKAEGVTLTGSGNMYVASLPREIEVAVGDVVYTQDTPGMILAVVREVVFDPRDPMKQVFFALPVNLDTIQTVAVLE